MSVSFKPRMFDSFKPAGAESVILASVLSVVLQCEGKEADTNLLPKNGKDLTRMNHDHNDDADLSRAHPTVTTPNTASFNCVEQPRDALAVRGFNKAIRKLPRRTGASVTAEPIREIVVIVLHPRQVFRCLASVDLDASLVTPDRGPRIPVHLVRSIA